MFRQIQSAVNSILPKLFEDDGLYVEVTYKKFVSDTFDPAQGFNVEQYTDHEVRAIRLAATISITKRGGIRYDPGTLSMQRGECVFMFQPGDLPSGLSLRDVIVQDGRNYAILNIENIFGLALKIQASGAET